MFFVQLSVLLYTCVFQLQMNVQQTKYCVAQMEPSLVQDFLQATQTVSRAHG